ANLLLVAADKAGAPAGESPLIKIVDMGLARPFQGDLNDILTGKNFMIGTPDSLAPQKARDARSVDHRADLYRLGCTFFYLLTGQPPFKGSPMEKIVAHHKQEPPSPLTLRPDLPPGLEPIVMKLLAKRPEDRYQTAAEVAAALAPFCR